MHAPFHLPLLALLTTGLALVGGCAGPEDAVRTDGPQRTASLRVVVWSTHVQGPVAAEGVLTSRSSGAQHVVQTRANPADGCVITGLLPGPYRLQITKRLDGARSQRVEGLEDLYLEPGQSGSITVVVTDREGELGLLFDSRSPSATPSHLPRAAARSAGPG